MTGHDHAWRAEAALERKRFAESGLQRAESVRRCKPFDCGYRGIIHLGCEDQTTARRAAVDEHRACATHTVLAPNVGTSQAEVVAQEIRQRAARLNLAFNRLPIQDQSDVERHFASTSTCSVSTEMRCRR